MPSNAKRTDATFGRAGLEKLTHCSEVSELEVKDDNMIEKKG
jgi:hypothetical protein